MEFLRQTLVMIVTKMTFLAVLLFDLAAWLLMLTCIIYSKIRGEFTDQEAEEVNTVKEITKKELKLTFLIWSPTKFFEALVVF